jgi:hypothetical protein
MFIPIDGHHHAKGLLGVRWFNPGQNLALANRVADCVVAGCIMPGFEPSLAGRTVPGEVNETPKALVRPNCSPQ